MLILGVLYEHFTANFLINQRSELEIVAQGIERYGEDYLQGLDAGSYRLTLIDATGDVRFDSRKDAQTMENHSDREEFKKAVAQGYGESTRYSSTLAEKLIYCAKGLSDGSVIRVASSQLSTWALLFGMLQPIALILVAAIVLSLVLAKRVAKRAVEPINGIDLENPLDNEVYGELSPLLIRIDRQNAKIRSQMNALAEKNREISYINENVSDGIIILDNSGRLISANKRAKELFHCREEDYFLNFCRDMEYERTVEVARRGESSSCVLELGNVTYRLYASGIELDEGGYAVYMFIKDVSDEERSQVMRREFSANVSHELKTPLTAIMGSAEIIENGIAKPEDVPHFAGKIHEEAARLLELVKDIIKLSRLDEGISGADFTEVELSGLCRNVASELSQKIEKNGISFNVFAEKTNINGFEPVLHEMIFNLCDNAVTYNRPGGSVTLSVSQENGRPLISVEDTGIGIAPEHQERIFERFYRVDKSHSKETGGTGLGLSIVKHGAQLHRAELKLESQPDKGTKITLLFPQQK